MLLGTIAGAYSPFHVSKDCSCFLHFSSRHTLSIPRTTHRPLSNRLIINHHNRIPSRSPPPEPKQLPASIARERHVSANERPAPSDNINPPLSPRTTTKTPNIPTHHRLAILVRDHIDLTIPPTSPTPASHANAMSRPTRSPHPTTTTTPSPIQHRRRKLLAFQTDITDLIPDTFMVNLSLGHYLGKLVAAKQASDDVWEMVKNRSHLAITAYYLFGRPLLTNRLLASLLDQDHFHLTTSPLSFEPASHRNFMHQPTRGPRLTTTPSPLQQLRRIIFSFHVDIVAYRGLSVFLWATTGDGHESAGCSRERGTTKTSQLPCRKAAIHSAADLGPDKRIGVPRNYHHEAARLV